MTPSLRDISTPDCSSKFFGFKTLDSFFGSAICLNMSHVHHTDIIDLVKLKLAISKSKQQICPGDIVLLYTGHGDRFYNTSCWRKRRTLMTYSAIEYLEQLGVKNLGLDAPSVLIAPGVESFDMAFTFSLSNIGHLVNTRFIFMGFPVIPIKQNEYLLRAAVIL